MKQYKEKSPDLADRGYSKNIHLDTANNQYFNMILSNSQCQKFCCELLERFDGLLERFSPGSPTIYQGNEIDAFIALSNIERNVDESGRSDG